MRKLRKVLLFFVCAAITSSLVPGISACKKTGNESAGRIAERDVSENDGKNPQGGSADNDPSKEDETGDSSRKRYAIYYADGEKIGEILLENGGIGKDDLAVPEKRGYLGNWKTPTEDENGNFYIEAEYTAIVYTITYAVLRGADNSGNPDTYTVETESFSLLPPKSNGRVFLGWYTDNNYENPIGGIEKGSIGNLTVYANWQIAEEE